MRLAILFIIISIICVIATFFTRWITIGISTTFATLAGAILVFSTLDVQRKVLDEEISKNYYSLFDSRFYPILSSFRMDAANMENVVNQIREKGNGYGQTYSSSFYGDTAFYNNRKIAEMLYDNIRKDIFNHYDADDIRIELEEIGKKEIYLYENNASEEEIDKVMKERINYLHLQQPGFLFYRYGITEDNWQQYKEADEQVLYSFLLKKLLDHQPTILSKYIQTLRFILHIIDDIPNKKDRKDYYQNISCLLGKEELLFLKLFNEFNIITN